MKNSRNEIRILVVSAALFAILSPAVQAVRNDGIRSPVGSGTVPPSSWRSGLIRTANPIDTSGNLVITGNVTGGRHFRGVVPYQSTSSFRAAPGSTLHGSGSLDSFLRRSASSEDFGRYVGGARPFYSPSGTVTTTRAGYSRVFRPPTVKIDDRVVHKPAPLLAPGKRVLPDSETATPAVKFRGVQTQSSAFIVPRPMSKTVEELERALLNELGMYPQAGMLTAKQHRELMEQFRRDLKQVSEKAAELKQSLTGKSAGRLTADASLRLSTKPEVDRDAAKQVEQRRPEEQTVSAGRLTAEEQSLAVTIGLELPDKQLDVYEQMIRQLEQFQKTSELLSVAEAKPEKETAYSNEEQREESQPEPEEKTPMDELAKVTLSAARAKAILGEHKSFVSFSKDKFNQHLKAAENCLKEGKYYRAADAYTMASIYKPGDPLAYAGKSHALFAAGEYMSSALFLSRALKIFPGYARFKIDLVAMVGDRDTLESRVADVEQWLEKSEAAELQFLLGYVYYQMGRLARAKAAIDGACERMPGSSVVSTLKKAIDDAMK